MLSIQRWMSHVRWEVQHDNRYTAFDGRLYLERRPERCTASWQARCWVDGQPLSKTTKSEVLADAKIFAEHWFTKLLYKIDNGEPVRERTLEDAYKAFLHWHEHDLLLTGASNPRKIKGYKSQWNGIEPFMGHARLSEVTSQKIETFRAWRIAESKKKSGIDITEKTLHIYRILLSQVLKYAVRHQWLATMPLWPAQTVSKKHAHPEWFEPEQMQSLLATSMSRIGESVNAGNAAAHIRAERTELHAFILFMTGGCTRVEECLNLRWEDVTEHPDNEKVPPFKRQLLITIRGGAGDKTGTRNGIGDVNALTAMNYLRDLHPDAEPEDTLFKANHQRAMVKLLEAAQLRIDSKGKKRSAKTLRHTSIMFRFIAEPTISPFELSKICGVDVPTLQKYDRNHLTGKRVSDRLMKSAVAEFGKSKRRKITVMWGHEDGQMKTARSRGQSGT